ncbi:MAG: AmmeMemoRadiSam system protein A [Nitrospirota bacterium]
MQACHNRHGHHPLVKLAIEAIEAYIKERRVIEPPAETAPELAEKAGVFVCLKKDGELRGCIGTFMPTTENVAQEVIQNSISAATEDPRFGCVKCGELECLDYSVDVLSAPEPVGNLSELDPKKYGVIVSSGCRRGLLLPDLDGVNTVDEQIAIARHKAGIDITEPVTLHRFEVKRYE